MIELLIVLGVLALIAPAVFIGAFWSKKPIADPDVSEATTPEEEPNDA